ncbi:MAG: cation:dicarboxylase symporter family transporter [Gemmatimonadota bacterium]
MSSTTRGLLGLAGGLLAGSLIAVSADPAQWHLVTQLSEALGTVWINAILMTVIPLITASLVVAIGAAPDRRTLGQLGGRAMAVFLILLVGGAIFTCLIMPVVVGWLPSRVSMAGIYSPATEAVTPPTLAQWLVGLMPANPVKAWADGAILPLIVFTIIFGLAITRLTAELREVVLQFAEAIRSIMLTILIWVSALAPVGVFALGLALAAKAGPTAVGELGAYVLMAVVLAAIGTLVLYPLVRIFGRLPMGRFGRAVAPAQALGFTSHSSLAALPALIEVAQRDLHYPPEIIGFCLPFSAATFKYSAPIASLSAAFFVSHLYGVPIAPGSLPMIGAVAVLTSFSVPGVGGGAVLASMGPVLLAAGMPTQALGVLLALDPIPNSARTVANVTGYLAATAIVAGRPGVADG